MSRAILMAGAILTIGIVAFALGLGVGSVKHDTYDDPRLLIMRLWMTLQLVGQIRTYTMR